MSPSSSGGYSFTAVLADEGATERLMRDIAALIEPGDMITLSGDLGAGKSTFARGALRALGVTGPIKSPSYTLLETYSLATVTVVHLDLYRLKDPAELEYLGLADYHRPGHLWLVEWPEHGGNRIPRADLQFEFTIGPTGHRIERIEKFRPDK